MPSPVPHERPRGARLALWIPFLAALALCAPVLRGGFVYDDLILLRDNPFIHSWSALWKGFALPFWEMVSQSRSEAGFYRPLVTGVFTLLQHAGGGSPLAFHAASWILNAACSLLVASLALRLCRRPWAAMAAGLLFAVHGAHAEPVAWASSLPDLLAAFFSLLALRCAVSRKWLACALWLVPALLSKEVALGAWLLCLILALRGGAGRRSRGALLLVPAALLYLLRMVAFAFPAAGFDLETTRFQLPLLGEIGLSFHLIARYFGFLVWPWPHAPFRPLQMDISYSREVPSILGVLLLAGGLLVWIRALRRSSRLLVPLGLLLFSLLPVLNTRSLGQYPFEERFLYLPSAGFALLAAALFVRRPGTGKGSLLLSGTALGALLLGNAWSLERTLPHWRDEFHLYQWAQTASPHSMQSFLGWGRIQLEAAQKMEAGSFSQQRAADQAGRAYEQALAISPDHWFITMLDRKRGNLGLGDSLLVGGDLDSAEEVYRKILGRWPDEGLAHLELAVCLSREGLKALKGGREENARKKFEEALPHFDRAVERLGPLGPALRGKGDALAYLQRNQEALPLLEQASRLLPGDPELALDLASVHLALNREYSARQVLEDFLERNPGTSYRKQFHEQIEWLRQRQAARDGGVPKR